MQGAGSGDVHKASKDRDPVFPHSIIPAAFNKEYSKEYSMFKVCAIGERLWHSGKGAAGTGRELDMEPRRAG
jgi:hypothetical protein